MNVESLNNGKKFNLYTTSKWLLNKLKSYYTDAEDSEDINKYWNDAINIVSNKNILSNCTTSVRNCGTLFFPDNTNHLSINEFNLKYDEVAYYVDSRLKIIENFLPFDNERLHSLIQNNIAPFDAKYIAIYKQNDLEHAIGYILLNNLDHSFTNRLYRVGIMSDIHYNDTDISDHTDVIYHIDGDGEYIKDISRAFQYYENKEAVEFVCSSGDISSNNMAHLYNFRSLLKNVMPSKAFFSCFGNHDYCSTATWFMKDLEYNNYDDGSEMNVKDKDRLEIWNQIITPQNPVIQNKSIEIHYQDSSTDYGKTSYYIEVPTVNGKSDIYAFLSVNYAEENRIDSEDHNWHQLDKNNLYIDTDEDSDNPEILNNTTRSNICIKFNAPDERVYYDYHTLENYNHYIRINSCTIIDGKNNNITAKIMASNYPEIGIKGKTQNIQKHYLSGIFEGSTEAVQIGGEQIYHYCIECSYSFTNKWPDITFPISVYLNVDHNNAQINQNASANIILTEDSPYMSSIIDYVGYLPSAYNLKFYDNASLIWLKNLLENNPNKRIFIFTHLFFPQKAGGNNGLGYSYAMDNGRITTSNAYCLCGIQFEFLNKLNNEFKNTIWFTGHSHYNYDTQITDSTCIICNKDFEIYRPDDSDFEQSVRYFRRGMSTPVLRKVYEYYATSTTTHVNERLLYTTINIPNGTYEITMCAASLFTPGRGFNSELYVNGKVQNTPAVNVYVKNYDDDFTIDGAIQEPVETRSWNSIRWDKEEMKYTLTIEVTSRKIECGLYKFRNGINWVTCSVESIKNVDNNTYINVSPNLHFYKYNGDEASKTSYSYAPAYYDLANQKVTGFSVTNVNTGYNVHIPSTSRPLASNICNDHELTSTYSAGNVFASSLRPLDSEGMIMDIYEDYVDIRGIVFKNDDYAKGTYINKYHPIAQYRIPIKST